MAFINLSDFEGRDADLGKDIDQSLLKIPVLERFLIAELQYNKESEKLVWTGTTVMAGVQEIEIKTDGGFRTAVLGLREAGTTVLQMELVPRP